MAVHNILVIKEVKNSKQCNIWCLIFKNKISNWHIKIKRLKDVKQPLIKKIKTCFEK